MVGEIGSIPSVEVQSLHWLVWFRVWSLSWVEEEHHWCGLELHLMSYDQHYWLQNPTSLFIAHRLESSLAIQKVQCSKGQPRFGVLVPLGP